MARPQKVGVDYFPLDVDIDQDDKVAIIEAQHGIIGFGIIVKLLMHIYKNSYYYEWTEKEQILFSRRVNVDINQVNVIINDCVKWGLFDEKLFKEFKILTSRGVQKRYFEIVKRRQRVEAAKEFLLLDNVDINSYSNLVIVSINEEVEGVNVDINPQSKVEESKVNKSKVNKSSSNNTTAAEIKTENPVAPVDADSTKQDDTEKRKKDLQQIENYYKQQIRRRNICSSRDLGDIVFVYETYKQDVDFIISVMEKAKEDYIARYGKLEINSFSYFLSIFEEKWDILHGKKDKKTHNTPMAKKTRFHNFEQRTDNMSNDDLEEIMRRKREEYYKKVQEG